MKRLAMGQRMDTVQAVGEPDQLVTSRVWHGIILRLARGRASKDGASSVHASVPSVISELLSWRLRSKHSSNIVRNIFGRSRVRLPLILFFEHAHVLAQCIEVIP